MALEGMPIVNHLSLTFVLGDDASSNVGRSNTREGIEARDRCCLIQPMIMWQVSCKSVLTSLSRHTGEKHSAEAVARTVAASAPHFELTSLCRMLFQVLTSALVF